VWSILLLDLYPFMISVPVSTKVYKFNLMTIYLACDKSWWLSLATLVSSKKQIDLFHYLYMHIRMSDLKAH